MNIEELLALDDLQKEEVPVPEWGGATFNVWSMTGTERAEMEKKWSGKRSAESDPAGFRADLLLRTMKNPDGSPFGTEEQIRKLIGKNAAAIERVFMAACKVSGFTNKDVEELEKN